MRFDKFTLKTQEIIQTSQQLAERFGGIGGQIFPLDNSHVLIMLSRG